MFENNENEQKEAGIDPFLKSVIVNVQPIKMIHQQIWQCNGNAQRRFNKKPFFPKLTRKGIIKQPN